MRLIAVGCEYAGKTTLLQGLQKWGLDRGIRHHLDDHFTIPDCQMLKTKEDREAMLSNPQTLKERFQRFQIAYHVRLINKYEHIMLGGFHIEEAVYGPRYYYPDLGRIIESPRREETLMPADSILVHLTASPEAIARRMDDDPHEYPVVPRDDIDEVLDTFQKEFSGSWLMRKFQIDTTDLAPESLLDAFFEASTPHLSERDLLIRMNTK
ncbi:MAG: hypothetical protein QGI83_01680 [Candidatus Latescibacteria bacterium]|jgi:hypothetical protein|nr:hypothetical protein [Candidatus Latescibacterota bacterium]